jgi:hypothetical protein
MGNILVLADIKAQRDVKREPVMVADQAKYHREIGEAIEWASKILDSAEEHDGDETATVRYAATAAHLLSGVFVTLRGLGFTETMINAMTYAELRDAIKTLVCNNLEMTAYT